MKKEEFEFLERICKDSWKQLAKSGDTEKPDSVQNYVNACPACQVAFENGTPDCTRCPVDLWRAIAVENSKMEDYEPGYAVCDGEDQWFWTWHRSPNIETRKEMAKRISRMNWTFIPEIHGMPKKKDWHVVLEVIALDFVNVRAATREEAEKIARESKPHSTEIQTREVYSCELL